MTELTSRARLCGNFSLICLALAIITFLPSPTSAVEMTSPPSIGPAGNGLLGRVLHFTTDVPTRPSFRVLGDREAWTVQSDVLRTDHAIPVLGLTFSTNYAIDHLQLSDAGGNRLAFGDSLHFTTAPPPTELPTLTVNTSISESMEPGYTFFPAGGGHTLGVDASGTPRWHYFGSGPDIHLAANGFLLARINNTIREVDFLGNLGRVWSATGTPPGQLAGSATRVVADEFHHDVSLIESSGNILTLDQRRHAVDNFPLDPTDPSAFGPVQIISDEILEIDTAGVVVNRWDLADMLDPRRGGYGLFRNDPGLADWSHSNAVLHDPRDDSIIVSVRNQDAVIKFDRASGDLKWILGPHENWGPEFEQYLLEPVGDEFEWPYHTHAPMILPNGNLMVHDNGNFRARPFDPPLQDAETYTRAVEFSINEETIEISQVWQYGKDADEVLYSPIVGDADALPETDNVLITFGFPSVVDGEPQDSVVPRIIEVDREGNVVFDLAVADPAGGRLIVYRAERIASLYSPEYTVTVLPSVLPPGDYNGNGLVEQGDLDLVLLNWGQDADAVPSDWRNELPSGIIDQEELNPVLMNWGDQSTLATAATAAAVGIPEPATCVLCLLAGLAAAAVKPTRRLWSDG